MGPRVVALFLSVLLVSACGNSDSFSGSSTKTQARAKKDPATAAATTEPTVNKPKPAPVTPAAGPSADAAAVISSLPPTPSAAPQGAITKGSFTVWTEPADPAPFQPYTVVIEVKLPANTLNFLASDLSGHVEGTDGYLQTIGDGEDQPFEHLGAIAHLRMFVPGAVKMVRDTVKIYSSLLKEQQSIAIEF